MVMQSLLAETVLVVVSFVDLGRLAYHRSPYSLQFERPLLRRALRCDSPFCGRGDRPLEAPSHLHAGAHVLVTKRCRELSARFEAAMPYGVFHHVGERIGRAREGLFLLDLWSIFRSWDSSYSSTFSNAAVCCGFAARGCV